MTAVKTYREFLDINQAAQFFQDKGLSSCSAETIKYLAYEKGALPRPTIIGRRAFWKLADLVRFIEAL